MDRQRGPAVPVIGLLLIGMSVATGIAAGHLMVDVITSLDGSLDERAQDFEQGGEGDDLHAWSERALEPWGHGLVPPVGRR